MFKISFIMMWPIRADSYHYCPASQKRAVASCFVYKYFRDLESIDHLCINPICRIGLIHKYTIDSHWHKWSAQVNVLLNNCKQNMTQLSLLTGRTVTHFFFTDIWEDKSFIPVWIKRVELDFCFFGDVVPEE